MSTPMSAAGVATTAVVIVAVNNVAVSHDPFPALLMGGVFVFGCVLIAEVDAGLGTAVAAVFLIGVLLTKSNAVLNLIKGL